MKRIFAIFLMFNLFMPIISVSAQAVRESSLLKNITGAVPGSCDSSDRNQRYISKQDDGTYECKNNVYVKVGNFDGAIITTVSEMDSAISTATSNPGDKYLFNVNTAVSLTANKTIPSNVVLKIGSGGKFIQTSANTLMINGAIEAPRSAQIFQGFSPGQVTSEYNNSEIWLEWFGGKGDYTGNESNCTDNQSAFHQAIAFTYRPVQTNSGAVIKFAGGRYCLSAVTVDRLVRFVGATTGYTYTTEIVAKSGQDAFVVTLEGIDGALSSGQYSTFENLVITSHAKTGSTATAIRAHSAVNVENVQIHRFPRAGILLDSFNGYRYGNVTGATNASPIVITTDAPHKLQTNSKISVASVTGNTAANVTNTAITVLSPTTFSLNGTSGNGTYGGGGNWQQNFGNTNGSRIDNVRFIAMGRAGIDGSMTSGSNIITSSAAQWDTTKKQSRGTLVSVAGARRLNVTGATNASPIVITTAEVHGFYNSNLVTISGVTGNTNANGTFIVQGLTPTTFALYSSTTGAAIAGSGAYSSGGIINTTLYGEIGEVIDATQAYLVPVGSAATFAASPAPLNADVSTGTGNFLSILGHGGQSYGFNSQTVSWINSDGQNNAGSCLNISTPYGDTVSGGHCSGSGWFPLDVGFGNVPHGHHVIINYYTEGQIFPIRVMGQGGILLGGEHGSGISFDSNAVTQNHDEFRFGDDQKVSIGKVPYEANRVKLEVLGAGITTAPKVVTDGDPRHAILAQAVSYNASPGNAVWGYVQTGNSGAIGSAVRGEAVGATGATTYGVYGSFTGSGIGYAVYADGNTYGGGANILNTVNTITTGTTPSVANKTFWKMSMSGATTITNFTNGVEGQELKLLFTNGNTTLTHGSSIILKAGTNETPAANQTRSFVLVSSVWYEM